MKTYLLFTIAFLLLVMNSGDDKYRIRDGNRYEGIKSERIVKVAHSKISFISVNIASEDLIPAESDSMRFSFYLNDNKNVIISIFEWQKNYFMDPIVPGWQRGFNTFSWPSNILKRNNIKSSDLLALATVDQAGTRSVCPIVVYLKTMPSQVRLYNFIILPFRTMDITYKIYDIDSKRLLAKGEIDNCIKDQLVSILWNCKDLNGNYTHESRLQLQVKGSYFTSLGVEESIRTLIKFHHRPKLK